MKPHKYSRISWAHYNPNQDFYAKFIFDYTSRAKLVKWGLCDELGVALESEKGAVKRKDCYVRPEPTGNELEGKDRVPRRHTMGGSYHDESKVELGRATEQANTKGSGKAKKPIAPKRRLAESASARAGDEEHTLPKRRDRTVKSQATDGVGGRGRGGGDGQAKGKVKQQQKQDERVDSAKDGGAVMEEPVAATEDTSMLKRNLKANKWRQERKGAEGDDDAEGPDMMPTEAAALDHGGSEDIRARLRPRK
jgi:hypothetical protein